MTDCISLVQLVRFLNQTIYKLQYAVEPPEQERFSLLLLPLVQPRVEQTPCAFLWHFSFRGCHSTSCYHTETWHLRHVKTYLGNPSGEAQTADLGQLCEAQGT